MQIAHLRERILLRRVLSQGAALALLAATAFTGQVFAAEEGQIEEIVVTGSLLKRDSFDSASPLTVLDDVQIQAEATPALGEIIANQTFNYGTDIFASHYSTGGNPEGNRQGANFRGLGEGATLSLLDGMRTLDNNLNNMLPQIAIQRIDILKDGASALYGADAVAGVINVVPKKNFEGAEVGAFYQADSKGDHDEYVLNFIIGSAMDRGHFTFAMEHRKRTPLYQTERPNLLGQSVSRSGTGNPGSYNVSPSRRDRRPRAVRSARLGRSTCWFVDRRSGSHADG